MKRALIIIHIGSKDQKSRKQGLETRETQKQQDINGQTD